MRHLFLFMLCGALFAACTSNLKKENEALQEQIEEKREAIGENLRTELEQARRELAVTDSLLTEARREHDELHRWVMSHATRLGDQSPEVLRLNALRAHCDSLKVEFEKQGHKVKFFMDKNSEWEKEN